MVRLLAWSSVAQAGYILAPLGALALARGRTPDLVAAAVSATIAYTVFYVVLEIGAFGSVIALRGEPGRRRHRRLPRRRPGSRPWIGAAFVLALIGLAGLPPGLAGLFAQGGRGAIAARWRFGLAGARRRSQRGDRARPTTSG